MRKYILLIAFSLAILLSVLVYSRYMGSAATTVKAVKIISGELQYSVACPGLVDCSASTYISMGYPVKIKSVLVSIGDKVNAGDKLLEVDKTATLQAIQIGYSENAQKTGSTQQSASENSAGSSFNLNGMSQSGILSQYGIDSSAAQAAQQQMSGGTKSDTAVDASAYNDIDVPDFITATSAGTVTQLNASEGSFSNSVTPIVQISDLSNLVVRAQVDETQVSGLKVGETAYINGIGLKHTYKGQVSRIYPSATTGDNSKSVVITLISFQNQWDELRPNFSVNVNIVTEDKKNAISVPYESVCQDDRNHEYVYVIRNGKAFRQPIQSGQETNDSEEIISGLRTGDTVVVNPPDGLKNGESVIPMAYKPEADSDS